MRIPGELPSVQDVRADRAGTLQTPHDTPADSGRWVVKGRLAVAGLIGGFALMIGGLPFVVRARPWSSIAAVVCSGLLLQLFFKCSKCGRRRSLLGGSGKRCSYCAMASTRRADPIEPS